MSNINVNAADAAVTMQDFNFRFKRDKETGYQRPPVSLKAPVPSVAGIVAILEKGGNGLQLLQDALYEVIKGALGEQVQGNHSITQETVNMAELDWQFIANKPAAERATIAAELWESFAQDFLAVMPALLNKPVEVVGVAAQVFIKKCVPAKGNEGPLNGLKTMLTIYAETPNAENYAPIIALLSRRLESYIAECKAPTLDLSALSLG